MLTYSTELEEIAYSKDADALLKSALLTFKEVEAMQERFRAGKGWGTCVYFAWHGDVSVFLLFNGETAQQKIRSLPDRSHEDTLNAR